MAQKPKKSSKTSRKLTSRDFERMWGDEGPYSQVRLCEETRILDDSVSRVFLVVEAEINPFTFEYIAANLKRFLDDEPIVQLIGSAENRGKFGYVASAGEVELDGEESRRFAREQADMTIQTLIRMHAFVMEEFGLRQLKQNRSTSAVGEPGNFGVAVDDGHERFVWNPEAGRVEPADGIRFFVVFAFGKGFNFKRKTADILTSVLEKALEKFDAGIEDLRPYQEYILVTFLLPFDVPPADFIEFVIRACNAIAKKPMFQKDYLVTNVKKPTPREVMNFLGRVVGDKDKRLKK